MGGLSVRHADNLVPSAFLTSVHTTSDLVEATLPVQLRPNYPPTLYDALNIWSAGRDLQLSTGNNQYKQKAWDQPRVAATANELLENALSDMEKARLMAVMSKASGIASVIFKIDIG